MPKRDLEACLKQAQFVFDFMLNEKNSIKDDVVIFDAESLRVFTETIRLEALDECLDLSRQQFEDIVANKRG